MAGKQTVSSTAPHPSLSLALSPEQCSSPILFNGKIVFHKTSPLCQRLETDAINYEKQCLSLSLVEKKPFLFLCNFGAFFPEILLYDSFSLMLFPIFCIIFSIWLLYKNYLEDPDNHDGVITHLELDILECEVK